ncbi:MAG: VIT1/CCC1 transporter family protein [Candidatus Kapaibacterium sp.]|jgi:VIT1/CCC1 family predicted Fe2+/Mn2+ transporter
MPLADHSEKHFTASETVRDIVIGMSDGLTVPFALAAGLSGAISASNIVVTAGLAEIAAGSIAMGLGGYLAAKSDAEHYVSERKREQHEVKIKAEIEAQEVRDVFKEYGISEDESHAVVEGLRRDPEAWVDFMMRFELGLEKPDPKRALVSALTIAGAYIAGGFIPLSPYMIVSSVPLGLRWSVIVTLAALAVFGYVKGSFTGSHPLRAALQTVLIGGIAAAAAFGIARAIS